MVKHLHIKSEEKKTRHVQKFAIDKKSTFLSDLHETWWKWLPYDAFIFTNFHKDWTKIMDFLLVTNFWMYAVFSYSDFKYLISKRWKHVHCVIADSIRDHSSDVWRKVIHNFLQWSKTKWFFNLFYQRL